MKKKFLYPLLLTLLSFGIGLSHASATTLTLDDFYGINDEFASVLATYESNIPHFNDLISYWQDHYSTFYPYYYVTYYGVSGDEQFILYAYQESYNFIEYSGDEDYLSSPRYQHVEITYDFSSGELSSVVSPTNSPGGYYYATNNGFYPLYNHGMIYHIPTSGTSPEYIEYEHIVIPSYEDHNIDFSHDSITIGENYIFPSYLDLYDGSYDDSPGDVYTEVNLLDYEYIILSLKNYNVDPFSTPIYTLGSLCFTPVYDYGLTEKKDIVTGTQTQPCTQYYSSYIPVDVYIIQYDLDYHAVYYIKAYDDSPNKIKFNSTLFYVYYFTSQN